MKKIFAAPMIALMTIFLLASTCMAATIPDGTYTPSSFSFTGGTGKVQITCSGVTVSGGTAMADISFDSIYYDYVKVNGTTYSPTMTSTSSNYTIPVNLNTTTTIIGDTTMMSEPHEIEYVLTVNVDAPVADTSGTTTTPSAGSTSGSTSNSTASSGSSTKTESSTKKESADKKTSQTSESTNSSAAASAPAAAEQQAPAADVTVQPETNTAVSGEVQVEDTTKADTATEADTETESSDVSDGVIKKATVKKIAPKKTESDVVSDETEGDASDSTVEAPKSHTGVIVAVVIIIVAAAGCGGFYIYKKKHTGADLEDDSHEE